ncbi:MAG: general secretion pathway protein D [Arenicella sp.]|jgi:general secretion pathway protein D
MLARISDALKQLIFSKPDAALNTKTIIRTGTIMSRLNSSNCSNNNSISNNSTYINSYGGLPTNHRDGKLYWLKQGFTIIVIASLVGCETVKPNWQQHSAGLEQPLTTNASTAKLSASSQPKQLNSLATEAKQPQAEIYSGQALEAPKSRSSKIPDARFSPKGGDIVLNFVDIPIAEAARMILSDQLGKEFSISPEVQGQVSLNNQIGLATSDLVPTLEVLLSSVNARLVIQGNNYRIVPGAENSVSISQGHFEIIPLRYIDAAEFAKLLQGYGVSATPIKKGNLLALNGSNSKIKKVRELARSFDINWLKGMSIGIFPVDNTSAETLRGELVELFGAEIDKNQAQALRIIAIERSNSIMVIANQADSVKMMGEWITRLDKSGGASNQAFFIYRVQNGRATDLAKLLESMFGNTNQLSNDDERSRTTPRSLTNLKSKNNFRVVADESTNSLIVTGSPHYYKAVREAMKQLDSTPLQVLVEARIMELTLSDDLQYGLEWYLNGSRGSSNTRGGLDFRGAGISAIQPGFSYVVERAGEVRAALNGLADDSRLKVLSSPSLMVLNNRTASILVGDEVPIPTRQAVSNISPEAPTVNEIEYRNTGILLTVSPRVNSGGMVTMEISQEVSSVINNTTSQIDAPTIQQRQLNSTVSIRDGQTVVLGGLIREQSSSREAGVPLLKNIPALGKLFSTTTDVSKRTELIVLITPRVISNGQDTDAITQEYRQKMIGLRPIPLSQL